MIFASGLGKGARDLPIAPDAQREQPGTDDGKDDECDFYPTGHGLPWIVCYEASL